MVIKTTKHNNKTIVQQLTELMNNALDSTVKKALKANNSMTLLKNNKLKSNSFSKKGLSLEVLFEFIYDWSQKSFSGYVVKYTTIMPLNSRSTIEDYWVTRGFNHCLDERTLSLYKTNYGYSYCTINRLLRDSRPSLKPNHPLHNDSTANSLLNDYKTFKGTAEKAVLALIKPLLINGFIERMMSELALTTEFIEVINNYNDKDYHLNRFVKLLEKGMMDNDNDHNPLELRPVWQLWDEQFLKERVVPFLKEQELSKAQRRIMRSKFLGNNDELLRIDNYYDYCIAYSYSKGCYFPELEDTLFLYDKKEFEHAVGIILFGLNKNSHHLINNAEVKLLRKKNQLLIKCARKGLNDWIDCLE